MIAFTSVDLCEMSFVFVVSVIVADRVRIALTFVTISERVLKLKLSPKNHNYIFCIHFKLHLHCQVK